MRTACSVIFLLLAHISFCQDVGEKIGRAINLLQQDSQFRHAAVSLYVVDGKTGKVVFEKNADLGMAPGSTQKLITSASAFEMLGKGYQYKTAIGGDVAVRNGTLQGNLQIIGSGDPTLGSWRWSATKENNVSKSILKILHDNNIKAVTGSIYIDDLDYPYAPIPDGWIWQDIGNYYGAGAWAVNWHENQYDLHLRSPAAVGARVQVISTSPMDFTGMLENFITSGKKGSGDNGYLYVAPYGQRIFATGTIPAGEKDFVISGSVPDPPVAFGKFMLDLLTVDKISINKGIYLYRERWGKGLPVPKPTIIYGSLVSPPLDSINYWFLKKSVNLYGEAFVKTIALKAGMEASTYKGVEVIRDFWDNNGIERSALNMADGSGLSPANRITAKALVQVLQYAKNKEWYGSFYNALPVINGISMKDGYIGGVRAYAGYTEHKNGAAYTFSFIINNFDGSAGTVREKMWKVLDLLK
jgi:D-alanyl-D-alanine carboxypeptidase/D-alanyl-D-alanine-endopeptidase (penicillin-binding protein 4)